MAMKDGNSEVESDKDGIKISQIVSVDNCKDRETFQNILCSINNYLYKNKGAASDFMLIRDIVERNCDSKEEEINTQTPIPLYIGLMGTMTGIIIGIGRTAVLGGGFSTFINNPEQAIGELMGGVAIAMIASLVGIILTTVSSLMSKTSKSKLEAGKMNFILGYKRSSFRFCRVIWSIRCSCCSRISPLSMIRFLLILAGWRMH